MQALDSTIANAALSHMPHALIAVIAMAFLVVHTTANSVTASATDFHVAME